MLQAQSTTFDPISYTNPTLLTSFCEFADLPNDFLPFLHFVPLQLCFQDVDPCSQPLQSIKLIFVTVTVTVTVRERGAVTSPW
jgi:hypothetical protein